MRHRRPIRPAIDTIPPAAVPCPSARHAHREIPPQDGARGGKESAMHADPKGPIPLCDLQTQFQELRPAVEAAVGRVLASGQVVLGPEVAALEREVAEYCGAAYAVG